MALYVPEWWNLLGPPCLCKDSYMRRYHWWWSSSRTFWNWITKLKCLIHPEILFLICLPIVLSCSLTERSGTGTPSWELDPVPENLLDVRSPTFRRSELFPSAVELLLLYSLWKLYAKEKKREEEANVNKQRWVTECLRFCTHRMEATVSYQPYLHKLLNVKGCYFYK